MKIEIPEIETIWGDSKDRMEDILMDLWDWADEHCVTLYFDFPPCIPANNNGIGYEKVNSVRYSRNPFER